jgi:hypothetical protein
MDSSFFRIFYYKFLKISNLTGRFFKNRWNRSRSVSLVFTKITRFSSGFSIHGCDIVHQEIIRLFQTEFTRMIDYSSLASKYCTRKEVRGSCIISINYINLNKAYPKDKYPLPRINQIMDSTATSQSLNFLNNSGSKMHGLCNRSVCTLSLKIKSGEMFKVTLMTSP